MKSNSGCVLLGLKPSFGFGDRTGLATAGHVAAMRRAGTGIAPIFPQQSIREMTRTRRSAQAVMSDAVQAARLAGWSGPIGADADHLKTYEDVEVTAAAGFTFFTIDPSDHVDQEADQYDSTALATHYRRVRDRVDWADTYKGRSICLETGTVIEFSEVVCHRAAVKYGLAVAAAVQLAKHIGTIQQPAGAPYEIELSVDETRHPTTLAEHYIVAEQCLQSGMSLVSLAPRLIGDFEKGVDFRGDRELLARSLQDHAAIARMLGPYKLSLHSGSDKLSMYADLARATRGQFHVKTAGTSYLEALRVAAHHQPRLFRAIVDFARGRYATDKATYHVSATLDQVPAPAEVPNDSALEQLYLECWDDVPAGRGFTAPGRQILHCTFGSVLTEPKWSAELLDVVRGHPQTYQDFLEEHFVRHLQCLASGM